MEIFWKHNYWTFFFLILYWFANDTMNKHPKLGYLGRRPNRPKNRKRAWFIWVFGVFYSHISGPPFVAWFNETKTLNYHGYHGLTGNFSYPVQLPKRKPFSEILLICNRKKKPRTYTAERILQRLAIQTSSSFVKIW